ncbi:hypothetical protein LTR84_003543 [Exophiala bonariae]|uniref:Acetoacetate decarboxylase n=1 Tax=Exophiala bonariae TaxID=1690606 RepID=A0AAV9N9H8_9EURO|nr:hypothetical protein LTR84_003543 [Exophiala bonariae]
MPFVARPDQVAAFQKACSQPSYSQEALNVEFTTTTEFDRSVLPPHLEPTDQAKGLINISTWQSNVCGDFELSSVLVQCKEGEKEGYWVINLIVSEGHAITWGRETWGEGTRLIEIDAELTEWLEPNATEWYSFEVKAFPDSRGLGMHSDPLAITLKVVEQNVKRASGKVKLTLRGTESDPLHTIPITSISDVFYISGETKWTVDDERPLKGGDAYLPFLVGRHYDVISDFHVGSGFPSHMETHESSDKTETRLFRS